MVWVPRTLAQVLRAQIKFSESLSSGHVLCCLECPLALSSTETWKVFWRSSGIRTKHNWDHPLVSASNAKHNMEQVKLVLETAGEHWQGTLEHAAHINKRGCKTDYRDRKEYALWNSNNADRTARNHGHFYKILYMKHWGSWWCFHSVYIILLLPSHAPTKQISSRPLPHSFPSSLPSLFYILEKKGFWVLLYILCMWVPTCTWAIHHSNKPSAFSC